MDSSVLRLRTGGLIALTLAIALAIAGLSAWTLWEARQENWRRASLAARNLGQAVSQEIARTIESLDLTLQAVMENSRLPGIEALEPALRNRFLFDRAAMARHLGSILVLDAEGSVLLDSRRREWQPHSRADREYFTYHRDHPEGGRHISPPYKGRTDEEWMIAVSRRLSRPDGSFAGVVVGSIRLAPIRALFESLDLGPNGTLVLLRDDGVVLMRTPYREEMLGSDVSGGQAYRLAMRDPGGQFVAEATLDGVRRLHTRSRVEGAPLMVGISLAVADIEAGWWRHALQVGLATFALVAALTGTALLLRRELRRRQAAEQQARAIAAQFRLLAENCTDMVTRLGPDGIRRYASPGAWRLLGRAPESLVGRRPRDDVHPEDVAALTAAGDLLRAGKAEEAIIAYRVRHAERGWIWVESSMRTLRDPESGRRDGMVAVTRDITERKALEAELARLATLDGLTGIPNRRSFALALEREWLRCARAALPVSVLLIDIDHFKALNDRFGHGRGDECLRRVATAVTGATRRAGDLAARYGGEEFAILLPEAEAAGAAAVAERVRAAVEALALPDGAAGGPVTVSIGAATIWPMDSEAVPAAEALVELADQGLYEAKRAGRNRTVHRRAAPVLEAGEAGCLVA